VSWFCLEAVVVPSGAVVRLRRLARAGQPPLADLAAEAAPAIVPGSRRELWPAVRAAMAPMLRSTQAGPRLARVAGGAEDHVVLAELPDLPDQTPGDPLASTFSRRCVQLLDWLAPPGVVAADEGETARSASPPGVAPSLSEASAATPT
jgi:hypothetical protein